MPNDLKAVFTTKVGPLPAIAWAGMAGAAYVGYRYWTAHKTAATTAATTTAGTDASGLDANGIYPSAASGYDPTANNGQVATNGSLFVNPIVDTTSDTSASVPVQTQGQTDYLPNTAPDGTPLTAGVGGVGSDQGVIGRAMGAGPEDTVPGNSLGGVAKLSPQQISALGPTLQ